MTSVRSIQKGQRRSNDCGWVVGVEVIVLVAVARPFHERGDVVAHHHVVRAARQPAHVRRLGSGRDRGRRHHRTRPVIGHGDAVTIAIVARRFERCLRGRKAHRNPLRRRHDAAGPARRQRDGDCRCALAFGHRQLAPVPDVVVTQGSTGSVRCGNLQHRSVAGARAGVQQRVHHGSAVLPAMRVHALGQRRHVRLPLHILERRRVLAQQPRAAPQQGAVRRLPRVPPAEDVLPHHLPAAVEERRLHDLPAVERGTDDRPEREARLQPADGQQLRRRHRAPLQPTARHRVQRTERRRSLRIEHDVGIGALQRLAESRRIHGDGVQEHPVGADRRDDPGQRLAVGTSLRLAPGTGVPRVVVHEHAHAAGVRALHQLAQRRQTAGHVAIHVELVAPVDPQPRIGLPQQHEVVAAELALAIVQDLVNTVAARRRDRRSGCRT